MRALKLCAVFVSLLALLPASVLAQAPTASTGVVQGTVSDATGAVIPGAEVSLNDLATNISRSTTTNAAGVYIFASVTPGTYKVTVKKEGFRQAVIPSFKVDVAKSHLLNFTLEVGTVAETVEVMAGAAAELQTSDATVGNVLGGEALLRMPLPGRDVTALLMIQPLTVPGRGVDNTQGGQVAGARSDQTTFLLDGGDTTSSTEGTGSYNSGFVGTPRAAIPTPAESIEEFRVTTATPNATFNRSQGGQVSMITRRGTNDIHGSAYWYHQNDNLNANSWTNNRTGIIRPELKDNRYGVSLGAPIQRDTTWIFGHYEGRRFPQKAVIQRLVPRPSLQQGILRFRDNAGNIISYNLNPANGPLSSACGNGTQACDPRSLGISPVINTLLALYPAGNNTTAGDGLNTIGFRTPVDTSLETEFAVARLDRKLSDKWDVFASGRYYSFHQPGTQQVDIVGLTGPGPHSTRKNPLAPKYYIAGVNGQLTPSLTSETRVSYLRHWWEWQTQAPFPQVTGTAFAIDMGGESVSTGGSTTIADPVNIDTQNARSRIWDGQDFYVAENLVWVKGKHSFQFGGDVRRQNIFHMRTDKVTGGLSTAPILYIQDGTFILSPTAVDPATSRRYSPPICAVAGQANCLRSADRGRWNTYYSSLLGMVDRMAQIGVRDGSFNPQALGTNVQAHVLINAYEFYGQDVWRIRPDLTITVGLSYNLQMPPKERDGKQTLPVFAAATVADGHSHQAGEPITMDDYYFHRALAAAAGNVFDPDIGFSPIRSVGSFGWSAPTRPDRNNFGPRVALAWNPAFQNAFFGNRKTVLRAGWTTTYTRMNGVGLVMTPVLGMGLAETVLCRGPNTGGACAALVNGMTANTAFRLGVDGNGAPLLPLAQASRPAPAIPFVLARGFPEQQSATIDPGMKLGLAHSADFTWQRELPGNMLVEVGYMGRVGRNLQHVADVNALPYFQFDPASGTIVAQAFDCVAEQIRGNPLPSFCPSLPPSATTGIVPHPWFENQLGAGGTDGLVTCDPDDFFFGNLGSLFLSCTSGYTNDQIFLLSATVDGHSSDYHAGFITVRRRMSQGLYFDVNYTLSKSIDQFGLNQEYVFYSFMSPWNKGFDRGPSPWDRRHVLNATYYYDLPFGRGRRFAAENSVADKLVGGWYFSGVFSANSGLPSCFAGYASFGALTGFACARPTRAIPTDNKLHPNVVGTTTVPWGAGATAADLGDPATRGSGLNLFANPAAIYDSFRFPLLSQDGRAGLEGFIRGFPRWNLDMSVGKKTSITEKVRLAFQFDMFNFLNHFEPGDPSTDIADPGALGVVQGQFGAPRTMQFGFRIEF